METSPSTPVTIRKYLNFRAPAGFRDELLYGKIVLSPEPKPLHFDIAENLFELLKALAPKQFKVAQRVNLSFPSVRSMPSPDVFVLPREDWRKARTASGYPEGKSVILAIEILSPSNRKKNIDPKVKLYNHHGIEAWVVNPKTCKITRHTTSSSSVYEKDQSISLPSRLTQIRKAIPLLSIFKLS
jgi:Uma2 family endonuclease